jgi:hypothetical protein
MLRLFLPPNATPERQYIADVVFKQFLGLDIEICQHESHEVVVTDGGKRRLILDDSFFKDLDEPPFQANKLPSLPLTRWDVASSGLVVTLVSPQLPVLFGTRLTNGNFLESHGKELRLGIDVLGSSFFMLTRYEESASLHRDRYDRFPASESIAFKEGFLERPIVNEYVEILWQCLYRLWSGLVRRQRSFRLILSHDVDQPFLLRKRSLLQVASTMLGDGLKRASPIQALKRPAQWMATHCFGPQRDPAYTFNYIMDISEAHGSRSAFYFIPSLSAGPPDYRYGIHDPDISRLMSDIHVRGHEIGYHASINTYRDRNLIQKEMNLLRDACKNVAVRQDSFGSRQHYLRIQVPVTLRYLAEVGVAYDTSLGYADHAGFRCGTCWEYEFYDLENRKRLGIVERPLIVMECSVIDDQYMGLGHGQAALEIILRLARLCRAFSGDFTMLWHNTRLIAAESRNLYEQSVKGVLAA